MKVSCRAYTPSCLGMVVKVEIAKVPSSIESSSSVDGVEASLFAQPVLSLLERGNGRQLP
jgi:hypothetical protein